MNKNILSILLLCCGIGTAMAQKKDLSAFSLAQLDSLYNVHYNEKAFESALACALAMQEKGDKQLNIRDTAYATILRKVGNSYRRLQQTAQAEIYLKKAIDIQKIKCPKEEKYAYSLYLLGANYMQEDRSGDSEKTWSQALEILDGIQGAKPDYYGYILNNLGFFYDDAGDYPQAEIFYKRSLQARKETFGDKHPKYADCLSNLGTLYAKMGDYTKAESCFLQDFAIQKETVGEEHPNYAGSLNNLGALYYSIGDYARAENYYLQDLDITKRLLGDTTIDYAKSLNNLGILYDAMSDYAKAEHFYLLSLQIRKQTEGISNPEYANALNNLGILYENKEEYTKAEGFYLQSIDIRKIVLGYQHPDYAQSLSNLGHLYHSTGFLDKAETFLKQALVVKKQVLGAKHPDCATSLLSLGQVYYAMKNYAQAEKCLLEAIAIQQETLGVQHPYNTPSHTALATVYNLTNRFDLAWTQLLAAIKNNTGLAMSRSVSQAWADSLAQAPQMSYKYTSDYFEVLYLLLEKEQQSDFRQQQIIICNLVLRLLERGKNELTNDTDKLRTLAHSNDWLLRLLKLLDKNEDAAQAFVLAEQHKSVLLLDAVSNKRAYSFGVLPDSLVQQEKNLQKEYTNTIAALSEKRSESERDALQKNLAELNLKIGVFQKNIKQHYPKYASLKYQHESASAQVIQSMLGEKTALLEYLVGDSVVYVFYVDKKAIELHALPLRNDTLKAKTEVLHKALSNYAAISQDPERAYRTYTQPAHWFYAQLLSPVLQGKQGIDQLIIITDGVLGHIPFETFLVEPAPQNALDYEQLHYLLQDFKISYHYSATLWKENRDKKNRPNNNSQILAMAAKYGAPLDSSLLSHRLPAEKRLRELLLALPAARKEVETLAANFSGFFALDSFATERVFKQKAADFAVIHLAMHGLLDKKEQLLSSLAFTEDGDSSENNFLHAYEISKMELNADLIVLSACETGYGKFEKGNGIASLARAFMYAGAPALVVSLWEVNDASTGQLMQLFYDNIANGMEKDEALRQAKLHYIQSAKGISAHPAYWSPFVQMGDTAPISIQRSTGTRFGLWFMIGGAGLLLLGLALAWRRR